jgi:hypothetical protein
VPRRISASISLCAYSRSSGHAQSRRHRRRVVGDQGGAVGARDHEAFAGLAQRIGNPAQLRFRRRQEHAELVAAHPVRNSDRRRAGRKFRREAGEQGIAGGMSEGVVGRLEAVEVEEGQHPPFSGTHTIELAPVGKAGEGIRHCLVTAGLEQPSVLPEAECRAREDEHDRRARKNERHDMHGPDRRRDEHTGRDETAHDRRPDHRPLLELDAWHPDGRCQAASATRMREAGHARSMYVPSTYVPTAVW